MTCGSFALAEITMPREGVKKEQRCFTDEEVGRIIAAAPEPFGTILAVTSVLGLRVSDLDFARKIVRVRQVWIELSSLFETHKLFILRSDRTAKIARNAEVRYTAGTRAARDG